MFYLKIIGYLRDVLLAYYLGNGILSNLYVTIQQICVSFYNIINEGPISSSFIPAYNKLKKENEELRKNFYNYTFSTLFITALIILIILELFSYQINLILFSKYNSINTLILLRISFIFIFFNILSSFFTAVLNSEFKFLFPSFISSITNILSIYIIINFYDQTNHILYYLCLNLSLSSLIQLISFLVFFKECRPVLKILKNKIIKNKHTKDLVKNFFSNLISINLFNFFVLTLYIFSFYFDLNQSHIYFSLRIVFLPIFFIGISIFFVTLPYLNEYKISNNNEKILELISNSLKLIIITSIPLIIFIYLNSIEIVELLLERGKFSRNDTIVVSNYLKILIFAAPSTILSKLILNICFLYNKNIAARNATLITFIIFLFVVFIFKDNLSKYTFVSLIVFFTWFQLFFILSFISNEIKIKSNFKIIYFIFKILFFSLFALLILNMIDYYALKINIIWFSILFFISYILFLFLFKNTRKEILNLII